MIYGQYAETEGQMSTRDLLNFLLNEQREQASMDDAVKLIEKYEVDGTGRVFFFFFLQHFIVLTDTCFASRCV